MKAAAAFLVDCVSNSAILTMLLTSAAAFVAVRVSNRWGVDPVAHFRLPHRRRQRPSPRRRFEGHVPIRHVMPGTWGRKPHGW